MSSYIHTLNLVKHPSLLHHSISIHLIGYFQIFFIFFFCRDGNEESFVQSYIALVPNNESRLDTELDNSHLTVKELTKREKDRKYKREQRANKEYRYIMIIYIKIKKRGSKLMTNISKPTYDSTYVLALR